MPKPKLNRAREKRITDEIVVDACNGTERAMGWYCYLEDKLEFLFKARCVVPRTISPLHKGEEVEVIAMAHADDCMREMFVRIEFAGRKSACCASAFSPRSACSGSGATCRPVAVA